MIVKILLPAYNEENALPHLFEKIHNVKAKFKDSGTAPRFDLQILLVNDGSSDRTLEIGKGYQDRLGIELLSSYPNKGLAETVKRGIIQGVKNMQDDDILVIMDADNSHQPDLIYRMIAKMEEGYDIVIASRYCKGARVVGVTPYRRVLSRCASLVFRIVYPIKGVKDYTCGYRAYRVKMVKQCLKAYGDNFIEYPEGFVCMAEILIKASKLGSRFCEVPLTLRYDEKKSISKMRVWKTAKATIKLLFAHSLKR